LRERDAFAENLMLNFKRSRFAENLNQCLMNIYTFIEDSHLPAKKLKDMKIVHVVLLFTHSFFFLAKNATTREGPVTILHFCKAHCFDATDALPHGGLRLQR
jgi:hypothetical protein